MEKRMKSTVKVFPALLVLVLIVFGLTATNCKREEKEDYYAAYYDAIGEGYVFMCDFVGNIMYPVQGLTITVTTWIDKNTDIIFSLPTIEETYTTDANGRYQVRFIKRTYRKDAWLYLITSSFLEGNLLGEGRCIEVEPNVIKRTNSIYKFSRYNILHRYIKNAKNASLNSV